MNNVTIFWLQLLLSCVVCGIVVAWYAWPYLTKLSRNSALVPLLFVHVPRYVGMTLLVTGTPSVWPQAGPACWRTRKPG
jgi:hypothetical protein